MKLKEIRLGVDETCPVCGAPTITEEYVHTREVTRKPQHGYGTEKVQEEVGRESTLKCSGDCGWRVAENNTGKVIVDARLGLPACEYGHLAWVLERRDFARLTLTCWQWTGYRSYCGAQMVHSLVEGPIGFLKPGSDKNPQDVTLAKIIGTLMLVNLPLTQKEITEISGLKSTQVTGVLSRVINKGRKRRAEYFQRSAKREDVFPHGSAYKWSLTDYGQRWGRWAQDVGLIVLPERNGYHPEAEEFDFLEELNAAQESD